MNITFNNTDYPVSSLNVYSKAHKLFFSEHEAKANSNQTFVSEYGCLMTDEMYKETISGVLNLRISEGLIFTDINTYTLNSFKLILDNKQLNSKFNIRYSVDELDTIISLISEIRLSQSNYLINIDIDIMLLDKLQIETVETVDTVTIHNATNAPLTPFISSIKSLNCDTKLLLSVIMDVDGYTLLSTAINNNTLQMFSGVILHEIELYDTNMFEKYGIGQDIYNLVDFQTNILSPVFSRLLMLKSIELIKPLSVTVHPYTTNYRVLIKLTNYNKGLVKY